MRTINKHPKYPGYIFLVHDDNDTKEVNDAKYYELRNYLNKWKFSYKEVESKHKDSVEKSFYIQVNDNHDENFLLETVKSWCQNASQNSFLQIDADRKVKINLLNGEVRSIGTFTSTSAIVAKECNDYTYCPITSTYFICKQ